MTTPKITPFLILLSIGLIILVPMSFYYLVIASEGGMGLAGYLAGIFSLGMLIVLITERYILRKRNYRISRIWIVESIIIILVLSYYVLSNSKFYYKVSDNVQWFVIIHTKDKTDKQIKYSFPNNRIMVIDTNGIIRVSSKDMGNKITDIKAKGELWKGYKINSNSFEKNGEIFNYEIYTHYDYKLKNIDSVLINQGLEPPN